MFTPGTHLPTQKDASNSTMVTLAVQLLMQHQVTISLTTMAVQARQVIAQLNLDTLHAFAVILTSYELR